MADNDNKLGRAKPLASPGVPGGRLLKGDLDDLYQFSLLNKSSVDLGLSGMKKANLDIELYAFKVSPTQIPKKFRNLDFRKLKAGVRNKYLQLVGASKKGGTASESIKTDQEAGSYLVRVLKRTGNSKYNLSFSSLPVPVPSPVTPIPNPVPGTPIPNPVPGTPIPNPVPGTPSPTPGGGTPNPTPGGGTPNPDPVRGNSFETAFALTLPTTPSVRGLVQETDKEDYYTFTASEGDYQFDLTGTNTTDLANLDLQFYNSSLQLVETRYKAGKVKFIQPIAAGATGEQYYLKISQKTANTTASYTLVTSSKKTDGVKNTIAEASFIDTDDLNSTPTQVSSNYVVDGGKSSPVDYYRFEVKQNSTFSATLNNMFGNLDMRLVKADEAESKPLTEWGTYDTTSETIETLTEGLLFPGEYILEVYAPEGEGSTYDLSMSLESRSNFATISANFNGADSGEARNLVGLDDFAFFVARNNNITSLYRTTGTADGLNRIGNFVTVSSTAPVVTENAFYFVANDDGGGNELWECTINGELRAITTFNSPLLDIGEVASVGDRVYFTANPGTGWKFYRSKLSGTGLDDITTDLDAQNIKDLTVVGDNLFFVAPDALDNELRRILDAGTDDKNVEKLELNLNASSDPNSIVVVDSNTLYLTATRPLVGLSSKTQLVKLENILAAHDGNLNDDTGIKAVNIDIGSSEVNETTEMFLFQGGAGTSDDVLYFRASRADSAGNKGQELMKLANPAAATSSPTVSLVADIAPGTDGSAPQNFVEFDNKLYFLADAKDSNGMKLWYTDPVEGTTISIAKGLTDAGNPASEVDYAPSSAVRLTVVGNTLYLVAQSATTGTELWQMRNSTLSLVQDINTTPDATATSDPRQLVAIGSSLFFVATDGLNGLELWSVIPNDL